MPTKKFVLRIEESVYAAIEKWAADEFRSVNGQIEWILSQKLKESGRMPVPNATEENGNSKEEKTP